MNMVVNHYNILKNSSWTVLDGGGTAAAEQTYARFDSRQICKNPFIKGENHAQAWELCATGDNQLEEWCVDANIQVIMDWRSPTRTTNSANNSSIAQKTLSKDLDMHNTNANTFFYLHIYIQFQSPVLKIQKACLILTIIGISKI